MPGTAIRDNSEGMYGNLMNKFHFGGANLGGVYFDEENRRQLLNLRATYAEAAGNLADNNRKAEAQNLLNKVEAGISTQNLPYAMVSRFNSHNQTAMVYLEAAYKTGNRELAAKLSGAIQKDLKDQQNYYNYLRENHEAAFESLTQEYQINEIMMQVFQTLESTYKGKGAPMTELPGRPATPGGTDTGRGQ